MTKLIADPRERAGRSKKGRELATTPARSSQERAYPSSQFSYFCDYVHLPIIILVLLCAALSQVY